LTPPGKYGRPKKGDLSEVEFQAIIPILAKKRKARGGSLQVAANTIASMRGADTAVDPRTKESRTVSARWVSHQLVKRGFAGKSDLRAKVEAGHLSNVSGRNSDSPDGSGPRMGLAESTVDSAGANRPVAGSKGGDLEVAKGGAA
jgi:hypothetical protein